MTNFGGPLVIPGTYTVHQAASLGVLPLNAVLQSVNGVAVGGGQAVTVAQILSAGNQGFSVYGPSVAPNGAINQQSFINGIVSGPGVQVSGPSPDGTSTLVQAPITGATLCANLVFTGNYGG
jgi:hypothetical protein